jgi:endogenous inhibitor of DNA gyrase (YacG/DUF329 family)
MSQNCPICKKKEAVAAFKPFCSKRCADIDLGRWFNGGYGIPTDEAAPDPSRAGEVLDFPKGNP